MLKVKNFCNLTAAVALAVAKSWKISLHTHIHTHTCTYTYIYTMWPRLSCWYSLFVSLAKI